MSGTGWEHGGNRCESSQACERFRYDCAAGQGCRSTRMGRESIGIAPSFSYRTFCAISQLGFEKFDAAIIHRCTKGGLEMKKVILALGVLLFSCACFA
ncbi:MAG: hypothetical protein ACRD41_08490, partial [Candidatus Acidiferrales bacterium]